MSPIARYDLLGPAWLAHITARKEALHHRLQVERGRAVDCVEAGEVECQPLDAVDPRDGGAEPVGAVLAALREDADLGSVDAAARAARAGFDLRLGNLVEQVDHLDMAEPGEASERFGPKRAPSSVIEAGTASQSSSIGSERPAETRPIASTVQLN